MPHIRTAQQLRLYAGSVSFLNRTNNQPQSGTGPSEYQIVNDFTMKLMDLQDKLRAELGGAELGNQAGRFARGLMDLQMHDSSVITQASLGNAVTTVTLDLPNFLKQKGRDEAEKTGYQRLVEAGEKYGSFTKEELDRALDVVGKGMDLDLGDPEKQKEEEEKKQAELEEQLQAEQEAAEAQAIIDAQANIAIFDKQAELEEEQEKKSKAEEREREWRARHEKSIQENNTGYHYQSDALDDGVGNDADFYARFNQTAQRPLVKLGILKSEKETEVPVHNGVPLIFMVKDGQVSTLEENGIGLQSAEFTKAMLRGEVFAYPAGSEWPVQMQARVVNGVTVESGCSTPLKFNASQIKVQKEIPKEPKVSRAPRWYHRWFPFWGNNRRICREYETTSAAHQKWEDICRKAAKADEEAIMNTTVIQAKFGTKRTREALEAELKEGFKRVDDQRREANRDAAERAKKEAEKVEQGISVARNIFGVKPEFREEYSQRAKENITKLSPLDIDPGKIKIKDEPLTPEDFAALAMFASMDPEISIKAYEKNGSKKQPYGPIRDALLKEGYSEPEMKALVSKMIIGAYTTDLIMKDERAFEYMDSGIDQGRKAAKEALEAYSRGDKTKLAAILANAVSQAGELAGSKDLKSAQFHGERGVVKLGKDMLDLMERDDELKALAKEQFDKQEREFCEAVNKQIVKYAPEHPNALKPRTFEENIGAIKGYAKFSEIYQKGLDARQKLAEASALDDDMKAQDKKECIKDILKANMATALYNEQYRERTDTMQPNGKNGSQIALQKYSRAICDRAPISADGDDEDLDERVPKDQQLPFGVKSVVSMLQTRFTEKAPVIGLVDQAKEREALDKQAEMILKQDGLAKLEPADILKICGQKYEDGNMMLRASQLKESRQLPEEGPAQPEQLKQKDELREDKEQPQLGFRPV